jgi:hypothetical protein
MKLLSIRAYARHRQCHPSYISKLLRLGKISRTNGKIDSEAADRALERNTTTTRATKSATCKGVTVDVTPIYADELARLTRAKADAAEMELAIKRGELVNRAEFDRKSLAFDDLMKRRLEALPTKLAPVMANQPARKVFALREVEVHELLGEFARISEAQIDAHVAVLFPQVKQ